MTVLIRRKVLDYGFVELLDIMGCDSTIAEAAAVSSGKEPKTADAVERLIRYLMRNHHTSPFEQTELKFRIKAPIFIARQWLRTRMASVNELSGRYSVLTTEFYRQTDYHPQSTSNKQLSDLALSFKPDAINDLTRRRDSLLAESEQLYNDMLNAGISREDARCHLPLSLYTTWIWKIDLKNLLDFIYLRSDRNSAQHQIADYADVLGEVVKTYFPITWQAFVDYRVEAVTLSRMEVDAFRKVFPNLAGTASEEP